MQQLSCRSRLWFEISLDGLRNEIKDEKAEPEQVDTSHLILNFYLRIREFVFIDFG